MKLIGMLDSPYVRRVAISLELYGVKFEHFPLSVFRHVEAFREINPVVKAPTLELDNGQRLMDSTLMISFFETLATAEHKLLPQGAEALAESLNILGLSLAASEKAVQHVYEHNLRPEEKQHQPWIDRVTQQLIAACQGWETALKNRKHGSEKIDQVGVTSAVVWSFIQSMIPQVFEGYDFPHIQSLTDKMENQPAFQKYPWH
ncbi:glutathione S-transferase [Rouxiella badensis]|jgi:glutathione S-transferase|uniref:Glutathione S-transferase n=1 Tax=Rouxiella badensis TaxID=1646377 RepID=A0A1X0WG21_9GAMM|nr:glutathione S-transferase [Rouxiella badensis]MCC3720959.1 glutathione S-transferase [Rouxiella badensis]MCC3729592.1 glutathione S-transferase [Rouxiella badensis]MCC3735381.1 glutathione S-transferase [Rouxiella badensis]MCC3741260.1 glutathione S-transferase [Rouxiella badensis]MCC3760678.1 glutathione S-transferase [Rouxiella badensis]